MTERRILTIALILLPMAVLALMGLPVARAIGSERQFIRERELPAIGMAIDNELERLTFGYCEIARKLSEDARAIDWMLDGERDPAVVTGILFEYCRAYGLIETGLVSDRTETYYGYNGTIVKMSPNEVERDGWYYLFRETRPDKNLDTWFYPDSAVVTLYINMPIRDRDGAYLGCVGVGMQADAYRQVLAEIEESRSVSVYLARRDGQLVYSSDYSLLRPPVSSIDAHWGVPLLDRILRDRPDPAGLVVDLGRDGGGVLWARFSEERDTAIIVERSEAFIWSRLRGALLEIVFSSLALILLLSLLVVASLFQARNRGKLKLEAERDSNGRLRAVVQGFIQVVDYGIRRNEELLMRRDILGLSDPAIGEIGITRDTCASMGQALQAMARQETSGGEEPANPADCVQGAINQCVDKANLRSIAIFAQLPATEPRPAGDLVYFRIAVADLLETLIAQAPDGSHLLVNLYRVDREILLDLAASREAGPSTADMETARFFLAEIGASIERVQAQRGTLVYRIRLPLDRRSIDPQDLPDGD